MGSSQAKPLSQVIIITAFVFEYCDSDPLADRLFRYDFKIYLKAEARNLIGLQTVKNNYISFKPMTCSDLKENTNDSLIEFN